MSLEIEEIHPVIEAWETLDASDVAVLEEYREMCENFDIFAKISPNKDFTAFLARVRGIEGDERRHAVMRRFIDIYHDIKSNIRLASDQLELCMKYELHNLMGANLNGVGVSFDLDIDLGPDTDVSGLTSQGSITLHRVGTAGKLATVLGHIYILEAGGFVHIDKAGGFALIGEAGGFAHIDKAGGFAHIDKAGRDALIGEAGGDALIDKAGGDALIGEAGGDAFIGEAGGDAFIGEAGGDAFIGEAGGDARINGKPAWVHRLLNLLR